MCIRDRPPQGNNYGAISNPEFDKIVAESAAFSGVEACPSWEAAESEMYASAAYVPISMRTDVAFGQGVKALVQPTGLDTFVTGLILVNE